LFLIKPFSFLKEGFGHLFYLKIFPYLRFMKVLNSYNVQIWCGLKETYDDNNVHTIEDVRKICDEYVNDIKDCVSITPTEFRYVNGNEPGVIVGYINYPRFPRGSEEILDRAIKLAEKLMRGLNQYRVTITTPTKSIMLENENPKIQK